MFHMLAVSPHSFRHCRAPDIRLTAYTLASLSVEHVSLGRPFARREREREERRERTGAGASRQGLPNEACSSHRARRSLTGPFFATRAPLFIYPQARDGQTRWEPDNLNRNNGKGEHDLSPGSPARLCSLTHIYIYATMHAHMKARLKQSVYGGNSTPAPAPQLPRHPRRNAINSDFCCDYRQEKYSGLFIQQGVFNEASDLAWRDAYMYT